VKIRIEIDELHIVAESNKHSADLDRLLRQRGVDSFVFIPLAKSAKRRRQLIGKKATLPAGDWHDGELQSHDDDKPVPGVLGFDIRRRKAREIAGNLGVELFFWGTSGAPVEQHTVRVFKDKDSRGWSTVRILAFKGLSDMLLAARSIATLPTAVQESQTTIRKFWQLVAVVLSIAVTAGVLQSFALSLFSLNGSTRWLTSIVEVLLYPAVAPAILVGVYLRVLVRKGETEARDFTAAEAEENWRKVAPHLLALWMLCWIAVVLLTWVQSVPGTNLSFLGQTSSVTTSFIVCLWMLLPIANSHNVESLFGSALDAAIAAVVSIFTIKLSLYLTNLLTDLMWNIVLQLVPFEIPEWLQEIIDSFINIGAEVFFVAVLMGYAWRRTRQQFMRL
jgi:hypothetical protein